MPKKAPEKNKIFDLVDKAPFAGRYATERVYVNYLAAPDKHKTRWGLGNVALLTFMVAVHANQAKMGIDSLTTHLPESIENPNAKDIIYGGIDGAFALAMAAVTVRQADLMRKVGQKHYKWLKERKIVPEDERRVEKRQYKMKLGATAFAAGATIAAQIPGVISYQDAKQMQYEDTAAEIREEMQHHKSMNSADEMYETNTVYLEPNTPVNTNPQPKNLENHHN